VAVVLFALSGIPAVASPLDEQIVTLGFRFVPDETTLVEGSKLEYTNLDVAPHNLIALRNGPNGKPAFRTETISAGKTVDIQGLNKVKAGVYDYTCTLHPAMLGTIYVQPAKK